ncbi:MAG: Thioredoxin-1 [Chlamydiae bacterium]|nr:Thioredoxin-1 [Chlamydiota bacterium]
MSDKIKHFDDTNFSSEVANGITLVDFYADWCGPCRMMTPVIEEFADKKSGEIVVGKLDIDASPAVTQQFQVTSVPTLILFKDGQPLGTFVGLKDLPQLEELVISSLQSV